MAGKKVAGIDLGTTYSCVVIRTKRECRVIEVDGQRTIPSYVSFREHDVLVGRKAKEEIFLYPTNTVYDAKRLVGRKFSDAQVQADIRNMKWPFTLEGDASDWPTYKVQHQRQEQRLRPEQISALVLGKLKQAAEEALQSKLDGVVITVPAYFTEPQRQATKAASSLTGLRVLNIINEPTAAALAYAKDYGAGLGQRYVIVFDLGGGTFDVSVVNIDGDVVDVRAAGGDDHLGGEDFTNACVDHFVEQIRVKHKRDLRVIGDKRAMLRLKFECEAAKLKLSTATRASFQMDDLLPGLKTVVGEITRTKFEELNAARFKDCIRRTHQVVADAGLSIDSISEVVLVGGSTRIPKVKQMLAAIFGQQKIRDDVNPDEVVAIGAAAQAAVLMDMDRSVIDDVLNFSLGTAVADPEDPTHTADKMSVIVPRYQKLGSVGERMYTTVEDYQDTVCFNVYEGEDPCVFKNSFLDSFTLSGIPRKLKGIPDLQVRFRVGYDGTISCTATDRPRGTCADDGQTARLRIERKGQSAAANERKEMARVHVDMELRRQNAQRTAEARDQLFVFASEQTQLFSNRQAPQGVNAYEASAHCKQALDWLNTAGRNASEEEILGLLSQLRLEMSPSAPPDTLTHSSSEALSSNNSGAPSQKHSWLYPRW